VRYPPPVLAAGLITASDVSFLLVGSAALWLRGESIGVRDADLVVEPGEDNVLRVRDVLDEMAVRPIASVRGFLREPVVSVATAYGRVDCLLERGLADWDRLRAGAGLIPVADVPVLVAAAADAWELRRRYKDDDE
jgi:hypothetical protein